jgi:hypothetical protein
MASSSSFVFGVAHRRQISADGAACRKKRERKGLGKIGTTAVCAAARIDPPANFHPLRHTYASRLAMRGVPLAVIAAQLGHSDTRMVEKHYGHLAPSYVAETVRTAFGTLGRAEPSNVIAIATSRQSNPMQPEHSLSAQTTVIRVR